MRKAPRQYVTAVALAVVFSVALFASTGWVAAAPQDQGAQGGKKVEHLYELSLIISGTYEEEQTTFTTGLEFVRHLPPYLGVGGAFEYLVDESWVFVFSAYFHPVARLIVSTGPGFERADGENLFLWRVGAGYPFEFVERYTVTPTFAVDFFGREEALVFGVNFGISF